MSTGTAPQAAVSTGADPAAAGRYLAGVLGDPAWASCTVALISGGKSNLTYLVTSPAGEVVLRRPPLAGGLPTAHDMVREHTVLAALWDTPVPVPRVRHLCRDETVLGAPFYVMDRVCGQVIREELPPGYADTPAERATIADGLVDVLVEIHRVDIPGRLDGYGPPEGYLARQMRRWTRQWEASREAELPLLDRLAADLVAAMPQQRETTLVHGGSTTPCSTRPHPAGSSPCSTGSCPRSATRSPMSGCCACIGLAGTGPGGSGRRNPWSPA